jgi:hypothetical protein
MMTGEEKEWMHECAMLRWEKTELEGSQSRGDQMFFDLCSKINPTEHHPTEIKTKVINIEVKGDVGVCASDEGISGLERAQRKV